VRTHRRHSDRLPLPNDRQDLLVGESLRASWSIGGTLK
jgi:hypothetical protein